MSGLGNSYSAFDRFQVDGDPNASNFRVAAFDGTADLGGRAELLRRLDRAPLSFAIVAIVSLGVLLLGWRGLSALVANRVAQRVK